MTAQTAPTWSAASELGRDFQDLTFTYYDEKDNVILPGALVDRYAVVRVDAKLRAQGGMELSMRGYPRNLEVR